MRRYTGLYKGTGPQVTAAELEAMALEDARKFFGEDVKLEVSQDYKAGIYGDGKFGAVITVREVPSSVHELIFDEDPLPGMDLAHLLRAARGDDV